MKRFSIIVAGPICLAAAVSAPGPVDLHDFLVRFFADDREFAADARYQAAFADLNGDGHDEALVRVEGRHFCGTGGCTLRVFTRGGRGWRLVGRTTITRPPVRVLGSSSRGWRDLAVRVRGGGIDHAYEARLSFDGRHYSPNPTMPPARRLAPGTLGITVIGQHDEGRLLFD